MPTAVRVHHQKVDGVTAHVQHTQSHGFKLVGATTRRYRDPLRGVWPATPTTHPVVTGIVD